MVSKNNLGDSLPLDISENDVLEAMKEIGGYMDITPGDARQIYRLAYRQALERLLRSAKAKDVMTRDVVSVTKETPLREVAGMMARWGISGVPVTAIRQTSSSIPVESGEGNIIIAVFGLPAASINSCFGTDRPAVLRASQTLWKAPAG